MRKCRSLYLTFLLCLTPLLSVNPAFGQSAPTITNVTKSANPTSSFPNLVPGEVAVIAGANLADATASAAPPQTLLGGVEVYLVSSSSEFLVSLAYVSPTAINFVVPYVPSAEAATIRIAMMRGGKRFNDLTSPGNITVGAVAFEASPNPALYDQPITLTAHITELQGYPGSWTHTSGTVTFMDGDTPLGTVKLSNVMTFQNIPPSRVYDVSFTTSKLEVGQHPIWVSYSGDDNNKPGTSGTIPLSVKKPEVTIWSSPNPSLRNQSVALVATFSPATCSGSVTFFDESDQLGTATIYGGRAVLQLASLPAGNHPITVRYGGDGTCPPIVYGPANDYVYRTTSQTVY